MALALALPLGSNERYRTGGCPIACSPSLQLNGSFPRVKIRDGEEEEQQGAPHHAFVCDPKFRFFKNNNGLKFHPLPVLFDTMCNLYYTSR
jgi:hypothetical protein